MSMLVSLHSHGNTLAEAISGGDAHLNFRYRYEFVDQNGFAKDANASTLRSRLNFQSQSYKNFGLFVELDDVSYLGNDNFNNFRNDKTTYPAVTDPDGTDFNQVYIDYTNYETKFRLGRQRINFDNQRFIGGVAWRQNEQTFDAFTIENTSFDKTTINYNFQAKVHRIFGPDDGSPAADIDSDSHLVNINTKGKPFGDLSFYAYFLDFETEPALSNKTIGLRYSHRFDVSSVKIPLTIEFAQQDDYGDNPTSYSANYYVIETGVDLGRYKILIGDEVLEGTGKTGSASFQTPLATLHKFQGWADKILSTPNTGIDDKFLSISAAWGSSKLDVIYHDLSAEKGSSDYGTEWDLSYTYKISKNYGLLLKAAFYEADEFATDTTKVWLMFTANF